MPGTRPQELHTGKNTSWSFIGTPETLRPGLDCRYQPPKVLKVQTSLDEKTRKSLCLARSLVCVLPARPSTQVGDLHALWRGQEFDIAGISLNIGNVFPGEHASFPRHSLCLICLGCFVRSRIRVNRGLLMLPSEGSKAYQWAFFADDSVTCFAKRCREGNPDSPSIAPKVPLLAVKLTGYKAAVNWLPQTHAGCVMTCKSLTFDRFDSENLLWVAEASEKSCLSLADSPAGSMRSGIRTPINQATQVLNCSLLESAREVLDWASGRERLFRELQERIGLLLSS